MHRTTTTHISDALEEAIELNIQLDDVEWTPIEQRLQMIMVGSMIMTGIIEGTNKDDYTNEEYTFLEQVIDRLNNLVEDMLLESGSDSDWSC